MLESVTDSPLAKAAVEIFPPGKERWILLLVGVMSLLAAIVETVGVAAVLPFMALVIDPDALLRIPQVRAATEVIGITDSRDLTIIMGSGIIAVIFLGNALSALNIFVQQRFSARTLVRVVNGMFEEYLRLPYAFHVSRDASSVIKVMVGDSTIVVTGVISPIIVAIGKAFVALGIALLLFAIDPVVSLSVTAILVFAYLVMFWSIRGPQQRLGEKTNQNYLHSSRTAIETLVGVKELIVLGRERYALDEYRGALAQMHQAQALNVSISSLPRYVLETLAFCGIVGVSMFLVLNDPSSAKAAVPLVALYGFSAYRLLPALQQIFAAAVGLRYHQRAVEAFNQDAQMLREAESARALAAADTEAGLQVHFREAIELRNVTFTYHGAPKPALDGIDLTIRPNESIGFVGRTGAGKTTLADVILGLYEPDAGAMLVDGVPMTGAAVRAWQKRVGFVSQHVFLRNASVAENIAFGVPPGEIDHAAVENAARRAQADEFIRQMPDGFDSNIGAGGVRLSGGQRQRIGIARALYHEPEVLVFDEATSALDGLTEDAVMSAIEALSGERTVILIAHRLRTVEACDRIVMLEAGSIVAQGSYQELLQRSDDFKQFVGRVH